MAQPLQQKHGELLTYDTTTAAETWRIMLTYDTTTAAETWRIMLTYDNHCSRNMEKYVNI